MMRGVALDLCLPTLVLVRDDAGVELELEVDDEETLVVGLRYRRGCSLGIASGFRALEG